MFIVIKINFKEKLTTDVEIKSLSTKKEAIDYIKKELNSYYSTMYKCGFNINF